MAEPAQVQFPDRVRLALNFDPGRLEDDPVYKRFPDDWKKYHTRYVTPSVFRRGLRPPRADRP